MKMSFFVLSATLFGFIGSANSSDLNITFNLLKSTLEFQKTRSVVLAVGNTNQEKALDEYNLLSVQKLLSFGNGFYFSNVWNFSKKLKSHREDVRETVVILESNEKIIHVLEKIFQETGPTTRKWLLITSSLTWKNFEKLTIPLNSEFLLARENSLGGYDVSEIYEVEPERQKVKALGRWVGGQGFQPETPFDSFRRRKNLEGALIKVISPGSDNCAETSFAEGIASIVWCINQIVWNFMSEMLNATTEIVVLPNITLDVIESTDAQVTLRSAPVTAADLKTRSFVWPLFSTKVILVASYVGQQIEWRTFISPFRKEMWMVILIWVALCDLLLACIEFVVQRREKGNCFLRKYREFSFVTTFTFCSQGVLGPSKFVGIRMIFLMMFIVPGVIFPGYSSVLTSFFTVNLNKKPFTNLEGLSKAKDYQLGWHKTFPLEHMFNLKDTSSLNQALLKNNVLPPEKLPATEWEGLNRICEEKLAYLTVKETVVALGPRCKYFMLPKPFRTVFTSMEIKKNSPLKYFLDRCILRLVLLNSVKKKVHISSERMIDFSGILRRVKRNVARKHLKHNRNVIADEATPIAMENIVLPFALLLLGVICSVILLIFEIVCFKLKSTRRSPLTSRSTEDV